ncbi:MAG: hypothetical protein WBX25_32035 [Rhodomicrobium sp.]
MRTDYATGDREVDELRRQVKDLSDKYTTMAQRGARQAKQMVRENVGDVEEQIRGHPLPAALIAAGIGFLIGVLLTSGGMMLAQRT